jgi:ribonuclease Z
VQLHPCEAAPRFVSRNENGFFDLNDIAGIRVVAGPLDHRVTCFGYCLTEEVTAGALDVGAASALGVPKGPMLATLKRGQSVSLSDGTVVHPAQVLGSATPGRKFVLLGDTCGSSGIAAAAMDATWLVHESTFDDDSAALAIPRGHSTARMAGEFARSINAKNLLLTHFSARFLPRSKDPQFMDKIEQQAGEGSAGTCAVRAVEDFECIELVRRRK